MFWRKAGLGKRGRVFQIVVIWFCISEVNTSVHLLGWRHHVRQYPSDCYVV